MRVSLPIVLLAMLWPALFIAPLATASTVTPSPTELENAVRQNDLKAVQALLDAGVDPNAPLRYGYTAVFHAVDHNRLDMVKLLLRHGAHVHHEETFFHATPLESALQNGHRDMVLLLLEHGPGRLDKVLQSGDLELVRAALTGEPQWYGYQKISALKAAEKEGKQDIVDLLKATETLPGWPDISLTAAEAELLGGEYRGNDEDGPVWTLSSPGEGKTTWTLSNKTLSLDDLVPVGKRELRSKAHPDQGIYLWGRGPTIEVAMVSVEGEPVYLRPVQPEAVPVRTSDGPPPVALDEPKTMDGPWASFRGPDGRGIADGLNLPTEWDVASGKNILWRVKTPGLGLSSPITDGERIFLTTAVSGDGNTTLKLGHYGDPASVSDESVHRWMVLAYDAEQGDLLWQQTIAESKPGSKRHLKSSQANSTPVTDGRHVVAVLPTAGLVCLRAADGKILWRKELGALPSGPYGGAVEWGFAASPVLWQDRLILQVDIHGGAYIAAWDVATGRQLWRRERDEIPTWSTPIIHQGPAGPELVTNGTTIRAYDPRTGEPLWQLAPNSEVIVSSPVAGDGLIYVTGGYPPVRPVYAVKPGSRGNVSLAEGSTSSAEIVWSKNRGGVYIPTPLLYRGVLYLIHGQGRIEAVDARDGRRLYRARLSKGGTVSGSAIAADGRLYIPTEEGLVYVVKAGNEYTESARLDIGEAVMTVPAAAQDTLYLRGVEHLMAIRDQAKDSDGVSKAAAGS